ncbi:MAG: pyruvate ferredoxin oxidoreductase [Dehalococcoidales bacterium]|nr:pyruvate ferredoxin oxidoreductase [Dehalococcoidales bacterium]
MVQEMVKATVVGLTGDGAAADAMRQINPDVVAAYPITPQTEIVERFAEYVADGKVNTEFVAVESEHSALSACCGAAAAGARVITCTASQGLALMHEMLYITAGNRLPIVMPMVNRALSAPINIHGDHSDSMGSRDAGWIQLYCQDAQEVYDSVIQAVRIAEHEDVHLPVMICLDGFMVSHDMEWVEMLADEEVRKFIGEHPRTINMLDKDNPISIGALALPPVYFEHKVAQIRALEGSAKVIREVGAEWGQLTGRAYGTVDAYKMDDAEVAIVTMSSAAGTTRTVVDALRDEGQKVGLLRIRSYRPFPTAEVIAALKGKKAVATLDRASSPGAVAAPIMSDISAALYDEEQRPRLAGYVFGLGGRDLGLDDVASVFARLQKIAQTGEVGPALSYLGLRDD